MCTVLSVVRNFLFRTGLLVALISPFSFNAGAELPAATQLNAKYKVLRENSSRDCEKRKVRAPRPAEDRYASYDRAAAAQLCAQSANNPELTGVKQANAAMNAAKLYFYLAERQRRSDPVAAAASYAEAAVLAGRSHQLLPDTSPALSSTARRSRGLENANYKLERLQIEATALIRQGLMAQAARCGGQAACLQAGAGLVSDVQTEANVLRPLESRADVASHSVVNELYFARASADRRLSELDGSGNIDRAMQDFKRLAADSRRSNSGQLGGLGIQAQIALAGMSLEAGTRLMSGPGNPDRATNAIRYLTEAAEAAEGNRAVAREAAMARLYLGTTYAERANMYPAATDQARLISDLCQSIREFDRASQLSASGGFGELQIQALEGAGAALFQLNEGRVPACENGNGDIEQTLSDRGQRGISAFEQARTVRASLGQSKPYDPQYTRTLAALYERSGQPQKALAIFAEMNGAGGADPLHMETLIKVALDGYDSGSHGLPETIALLQSAKLANPSAPRPDLEMGKLRSLAGQYDAADRALDSAARLASGNAQNTALRVEALYYRSSNETVRAAREGRLPRSVAASWAEQAALMGNAQAKYSHQACRSYLMVGASVADYSKAELHCAADSHSMDGLLLKAMNAFKQAQVSSTTQARSRFRQAEDMFAAALSAGRSQPSLEDQHTYRWPEMTSPSLRYDQVLNYGKTRARACAAIDGENVAPPADPNGHIRAFMERHQVFYCRR